MLILVIIALFVILFVFIYTLNKTPERMTPGPPGPNPPTPDPPTPIPPDPPGPNPTVPGIPNITSLTPGNQSLTINFTAPSDGGATITDYEYSTDDGETFLSVGTTVNPFTINTVSDGSSDPLVNGVTYSISIRAVNSVGPGTDSSMSSGTPVTTPSAPVITSITPGNQFLVINFTAPTSNGGSPITYYEYSTNGTLFESSESTNSPIIITGLENGVTYNVIIRAVNSVGDGANSNTVPETPNFTIETFIDSRVWIFPIGVTSVEYLVVGGGGGGGGGHDTGGGGGGGGGMVLTDTLPVISGNPYTVIIGGGGSASSNNYPTVRETNGGDGGLSMFDTIIASGGEGGKGSRTQTGFSGKGGEAQTLSSAAIGGSGGGNKDTAAGGSGGGGGGAGGNGGNGTSGNGGAGGLGITSVLSGTSITYGIGGVGARGNTQTTGSNGTNNRGNGGGGGAMTSGARNGGSGGSGIVILKY